MTLRISSIKVRNFKSLVDFKIDLAKFSCLIGLNGAGKSTVLQFVDFLSHLVRGDVTRWLDERQWKTSDLKSKFTTKRTIEFIVAFSRSEGSAAGTWTAHFNPTTLRCTTEFLELPGWRDTPGCTLEVSKEHLTVSTTKDTAPVGHTHDWSEPIRFSYEGSVTAAIKDEQLPDGIREIKHFVQRMESLDMLTPEGLRHRTRAANGSLGYGGKNLSAFVYELGTAGREKLTTALGTAYPQLRMLVSDSLRSGWKQLKAFEVFQDRRVLTESRHLNDGMLRLIAVLAELTSDHEFVLFDEIENGINPELIEFVIDRLVNAKQQVLVTTHSPMILNYLDDETARAGVMYLYRTPDGATRSFPFFGIPSVAEKLAVMGPGEAFVDTHLTELADEIAAVSEET